MRKIVVILQLLLCTTLCSCQQQNTHHTSYGSSFGVPGHGSKSFLSSHGAGSLISVLTALGISPTLPRIPSSSSSTKALNYMDLIENLSPRLVLHQPNINLHSKKLDPANPDKQNLQRNDLSLEHQKAKLLNNLLDNLLRPSESSSSFSRSPNQTPLIFILPQSDSPQTTHSVTTGDSTHLSQGLSASDFSRASAASNLISDIVLHLHTNLAAGDLKGETVTQKGTPNTLSPRQNKISSVLLDHNPSSDITASEFANVHPSLIHSNLRASSILRNKNLKFNALNTLPGEFTSQNFASVLTPTVKKTAVPINVLPPFPGQEMISVAESLSPVSSNTRTEINTRADRPAHLVGEFGSSSKSEVPRMHSAVKSTAGNSLQAGSEILAKNSSNSRVEQTDFIRALIAAVQSRNSKEPSNAVPITTNVKVAAKEVNPAVQDISSLGRGKEGVYQYSFSIAGADGITRHEVGEVASGLRKVSRTIGPSANLSTSNFESSSASSQTELGSAFFGSESGTASGTNLLAKATAPNFANGSGSISDAAFQDSLNVHGNHSYVDNKGQVFMIHYSHGLPNLVPSLPPEPRLTSITHPFDFLLTKISDLRVRHH